MNGARGFVQAIETNPDDPERVDVIWVVFNDSTIGRRYRAENYGMREFFDPGHPLATPIVPDRTTFERKGGIKYQRTNFPLSLAFALTAHKCQLSIWVMLFGAPWGSK